MKKSLFILLLTISLSSFYSCDECKDVLNEREALGIWLNFEDENTQQNLFFGEGKIYNEEDFELFYNGSADTLVKVAEQNLNFEEGVFYKHLITFSSDEFLTTLYYKLDASQPLDTIDIQYNEIQHECLGLFKESYDIFLNGQMICDDCSHRDIITIRK